MRLLSGIRVSKPQPCRITSYNVCYTKLLRFLTNYLPTTFYWENYVNALVNNGVARSLLNSCIVAGVTVGGCLVVSITASFALARIRVITSYSIHYTKLYD